MGLNLRKMKVFLVDLSIAVIGKRVGVENCLHFYYKRHFYLL